MSYESWVEAVEWACAWASVFVGDSLALRAYRRAMRSRVAWMLWGRS
jgi:hypothetical protein